MLRLLHGFQSLRLLRAGLLQVIECPLGIRQVPVNESVRAVTLTTMYYPEGVDAALLGRISAAGVVVAGGLHPAIAAQSFRVGHMGVDGIGELLRTLSAIEQGLGIKTGAGVAAAQARWME